MSIECGNQKHLHDDGKVDPGHAELDGFKDYCWKCRSNLGKILMLSAEIQRQRDTSPDGKTAWDRVEDYRLKHGHLPTQDGSKEPGCKVCDA